MMLMPCIETINSILRRAWQLVNSERHVWHLSSRSSMLRLANQEKRMLVLVLVR